MPEDDTLQVGFRMPTDLVKRIDAHAAKLEADRPGSRVTRSDAIRELLEIALRQTEGRKGKR